MPPPGIATLTLTRRHNSDDSGSDRSENWAIRRLIPLVAALALIAPSCPRDYGPGDYDPDATRTFTPGADEDLVYVSANSPKGDSDYVVAMPRGETVARIDGPDRRGWVFASATLAYYPMMRHGPDSTNTIHRIDLRTGSRAQMVTDGRLGLPFFDEGGPGFTALALTADKGGLVVARVISAGPRVWVGRYDAASGSLETERSWPIAAIAANVRLAVAGNDIVVVTSALPESGRVVQEMRFLDSSLRELTALSESDLPPGERCSPALRPFEGGRWATVCSAQEGRYASVLILDGSYRMSSRVAVKLDVRERVIAWAAQGGSVGMLTDRARHVRVGVDGGLASFWLGQPDGRTVLRIAREIAPGVVAVQFNVTAEGEPIGDIAILDVSTGRVVARAASADTAIDFVGAGDRLYVLVAGVGGSAPRLQRLDRETLAPVGIAATLPQRDEVGVSGLIALATSR